jgi:hypothetical protein
MKRSTLVVLFLFAMVAAALFIKPEATAQPAPNTTSGRYQFLNIQRSATAGDPGFDRIVFDTATGSVYEVVFKADGATWKKKGWPSEAQ